MDHRRRQQAYGRWEPGRVEGDTTRQHIHALREIGWTLEGIAAETGVRHTTVLRISCGITPNVLPRTRDAILTMPLTPSKVLPWGRVEPTGTRRRLQALMFMGWSGAELERRMGIGQRSIGTILAKPFVTTTLRDAVTALYQELWTTQPPQATAQERAIVHRTRLAARRKGWVGPMHWDDIDDTAEIPEEVAESSWSVDRFDETIVSAAMFGERPVMSPRERRHVITVLNERRWSGKKIAKHIGCNVKTVERIRAELGLPIYLSSTPQNGRAAA
jgi:hypothetical protein